jgi:hypothetical protein
MQKISFWPIRDEIQKVRETEWIWKAIDLANKYLIENPQNVECYLQLMDIYYIKWDLEKAEKPVDFLLTLNYWLEGIDKSLLYYIKAVLFSEKSLWNEAKKYIKIALKDNNNIEYKRLLWNIEFWSGNKNEWYKILQSIIKDAYKDADIFLDIVNMSYTLWFLEESKKYIKMYFDNHQKINFFGKSKEYYDKKMKDYKNTLFWK